MLKSLRKKGVAKKVIWVVAIVIIISFGFLGTAYLLTGSKSVSYAGKLYSKRISLDDFNRVYQSVRLQVLKQYGNDLNKVAPMLNLDARTWDRMILLHEAKKRHLRGSDKEVVQAIGEDPSFQRNSQFDSLLYNAILRSLQIRPRDYEEMVRDNIKISKLFYEVTSSVTVSENEIFNAYKDRNEKVQISYIYIANDTYAHEVVPQETEIKQYYEEHHTEFLTAPSVNVHYLSFPFPETEETEAEQEPGADAQAEPDPDQQELEKDKIRDKAERVFEALLVNPDMNTVAKEFGMAPQTTGFFSKEQPNLALGWSYDLLNRVFQMGIEEVNKPFETSTGMIIAQVKEIKEPYVPEYDEAKEQARAEVVKMKAKTIAQEKAVEYRKALFTELDKSKVRDFAKAAKVLGLDIAQTPVFNRGQYLPQVGLSREFQEAAFALNGDAAISDVVETEKGFCILHLDTYVPVEQSDYEKEREELAQTTSNEKRNEVFGEFILQLRRESGLVDNIPQLRAGAQ